jgi:hypothetical protein
MAALPASVLAALPLGSTPKNSEEVEELYLLRKKTYKPIVMYNHGYAILSLEVPFDVLHKIEVKVGEHTAAIPLDYCEFSPRMFSRFSGFDGSPNGNKAIVIRVFDLVLDDPKPPHFPAFIDLMERSMEDGLGIYKDGDLSSPPLELIVTYFEKVEN